MPRKHRPPRPRFWLAGPEEDIEPVYPAPGGFVGADCAARSAEHQRAQRSINAMSEADWVAAFSRSSNRYYNEKAEKAVLLPPPPRVLNNSDGGHALTGDHDDNDEWDEDWADGPLDPRPPRCWPWLLLLLLCGTLLGPIVVNGCLPWPVTHLRGIIQHKPSFPVLGTSSPSAAKLDKWIRAEAGFAWKLVLDNIGPAAGVPDGVVIASPSTGGGTEPDYFYTWTRDAALTLSSLLPEFLPGEYLQPWDERWYSNAPLNRAHKKSHPLLEGLLRNYAASQSRIQSTPNPSGDLWTGGLNEPKFQVTGEAFTGSWRRPQRDGPALRALSLIPYAHWLLDRGFPADYAYVRESLYDPNAVRRPGSVIKNDLEEVSNGWQRSGLDLWEEVNGRHLFTDAVARRALQAGAGLAARLGDEDASAYYETQAARVGEHIKTYCHTNGVWKATDKYDSNDRSGLDAAILLAAVHAGTHSANATALADAVNLAPSHPTVLASLRAYVRSFTGLYLVNAPALNWTDGWLVGRYAEDVYDGVGFSGGNPWYIATFAVAEILYLAQGDFARLGRIPLDPRTVPFWNEVLESESEARVSRFGQWEAGSAAFERAMAALGRVGDAFVGRAARTLNSGRMSEQVDRNVGEQRGARDLTWSYAAFLDVRRARDAASAAWRKAQAEAGGRAIRRRPS